MGLLYDLGGSLSQINAKIQIQNMRYESDS